MSARACATAARPSHCDSPSHSVCVCVCVSHWQCVRCVVCVCVCARARRGTLERRSDSEIGNLIYLKSEKEATHYREISLSQAGGSIAGGSSRWRQASPPSQMNMWADLCMCLSTSWQRQRWKNLLVNVIFLGRGRWSGGIEIDQSKKRKGGGEK